VSSTDLLKIPGTKQKANLYVTALVQELFTMQELVALNPGETNNDSKYQMIRGHCR
jgi:hypothetical protein